MGNGLAESDISMVMDSEFAGTAEQEKGAPVLQEKPVRQCLSMMSENFPCVYPRFTEP